MTLMYSSARLSKIRSLAEFQRFFRGAEKWWPDVLDARFVDSERPIWGHADLWRSDWEFKCIQFVDFRHIVFCDARFTVAAAGTPPKIGSGGRNYTGL